METINLTEDDRKLVAAVRAAAAAKPEFVYDSHELTGPESDHTMCVYRPTPKNPDGCIIGKGVRDAYDTQVLDDPHFDDDSAHGALNELQDLMGLDFSENVIDWANEVQFQQDQGRAWSEAVYAADKRLVKEGLTFAS